MPYERQTTDADFIDLEGIFDGFTSYPAEFWLSLLAIIGAIMLAIFFFKLHQMASEVLGG